LHGFVKSQKAKQDRIDAAIAAFAKTGPELLKPVHELAEAFTKTLEIGPYDSSGVQANWDEIAGAILVAFNLRPYGDPVSLKRTLKPGEKALTEYGARAFFRCHEEYGLVYGYRVPFFKEGTVPPTERFTEGFEPETLKANNICLKVVEFLEWASTGKGRGSQPFRFR
jgi:hypothetical protein